MSEPKPETVLTWVSKQGKPNKYVVSSKDREQFARCIWREGAPRLAVAWTLLQRFAQVYPRYYSNLSSFLAAYCQPINPRWFPGGNLHLAWVKRLENKGDQGQADQERKRAEKRVFYASTPWSQIPEVHTVLTDKVLSGGTASPVAAAMHFSSSKASSGASETQARTEAEQWAKKRGFGRPVPVSEGFTQGVNWFFRPKSGLPPDVHISTRKASVTGKGALAVAVGLGILALTLKK